MEDVLGNEIVKVDGDFVHNTYKMTAPDKVTIAKVHLEWATIRDEYYIEMIKPEFDSLLVLGYAIMVDNVERESKK
jgi:uncharacterized protein YxjI